MNRWKWRVNLWSVRNWTSLALLVLELLYGANLLWPRCHHQAHSLRRLLLSYTVFRVPTLPTLDIFFCGCKIWIQWKMMQQFDIHFFSRFFLAISPSWLISPHTLGGHSHILRVDFALGKCLAKCWNSRQANRNQVAKNNQQWFRYRSRDRTGFKQIKQYGIWLHHIIYTCVYNIYIYIYYYIILYYIIFYYIIFYYIISYSNILYSILFYYILLYYIILYYIMLYDIIFYSILLYYIFIWLHRT